MADLTGIASLGSSFVEPLIQQLLAEREAARADERLKTQIMTPLIFQMEENRREREAQSDRDIQRYQAEERKRADDSDNRIKEMKVEYDLKKLYEPDFGKSETQKAIEKRLALEKAFPQDYMDESDKLSSETGRTLLRSILESKLSGTEEYGYGLDVFKEAEQFLNMPEEQQRESAEGEKADTKNILLNMFANKLRSGGDTNITPAELAEQYQRGSVADASKYLATRDVLAGINPYSVLSEATALPESAGIARIGMETDTWKQLITEKEKSILDSLTAIGALENISQEEEMRKRNRERRDALRGGRYAPGD